MSLAKSPFSAIRKKIGNRYGNMQKMARLSRYRQMSASGVTLPLNAFKRISARFLALKTRLEASGFKVHLDAAKVERPDQTSQTHIQRWLINGGTDTKIKNPSS